MKVNLNGTIYIVRWEHELPNLKAEVPFYGSTRCRIYEGDKLMFNGFADCSKHDLFHKAKGRIVSLKRALFPFDKKERTVFWTEYLNQIVHGKHTQYAVISMKNEGSQLIQFVSSMPITLESIIQWVENTYDKSFDEEKDEIILVNSPDKISI